MITIPLKIYEILQRILFQIIKIVNFFNQNPSWKKFLSLRDPKRFLAAVERAKIKLIEIKGHSNNLKVFWFHVASAGELEQAIVIARSLNEHINAFFFVTYYSPSSEPFLKNFPGLLGTCGLPLDISSVYKKACGILPFEKLFFIRYDLWPALVLFAGKNNIELNLLCATKHKTRSGFRGYLSEKWNSFLYKKFKNIFVITPEDEQYFKKKNPGNRIIFAGDTKWWRAQERARGFDANVSFGLFCQKLQKYIKNQGLKSIIFGSPHKEEHDIALQCILNIPKQAFLIYAPHHVSKESCQRIFEEIQNHGGTPCFYSDIVKMEYLPEDAFNVMIVDVMGHLAEIYILGEIAVLGGGFDGQIHNIIEPCAHAVPILMGSNYHRAPEAEILVSAQVALAFATPNLLFQFLSRWVIFGEDMDKLYTARKEALKLFNSIPNTNQIILDIFLNETTPHDNKTIDHQHNRL